MSSLFLDSKQSTYRQIRAASQGASVSLYHGCGEFLALFGCATSIAGVLGTSGSSSVENVPHYRIPLEDMQSALLKLSARHSIALLEVMCDGQGSRFVLLWKVPVMVKESDDLNLDEY